MAVAAADRTAPLSALAELHRASSPLAEFGGASPPFSSRWAAAQSAAAAIWRQFPAPRTSCVNRLECLAAKAFPSPKIARAQSFARRLHACTRIVSPNGANRRPLQTQSNLSAEYSRSILFRESRHHQPSFRCRALPATRQRAPRDNAARLRLSSSNPRAAQTAPAAAPA